MPSALHGTPRRIYRGERAFTNKMPQYIYFRQDGHEDILFLRAETKQEGGGVSIHDA